MTVYEQTRALAMSQGTEKCNESMEVALTIPQGREFIDLAEKLTPEDAACCLGIPLPQLEALLDRGLFHPVSRGVDGIRLVPATALYPFLATPEADRLVVLERHAELAHRMSEPNWHPDSSSLAPLIREMEAQALAGRRALVPKGELVSAETLAELLWTSVRAIRTYEREGRIFSLAVEGQAHYPRYYSDARLDWRELEVVHRLVVPGWLAFHFLRSGRGSLGGATPLDALRDGKLEMVIRTAMAYLEL